MQLITNSTKRFYSFFPSMQIIFVYILIFILFFLSVMAIYAVVALIIYRVPLIPTETKVAQKMIALSEIKAQQSVYELGAGTGIILFLAEKKYPEARYIGYEILRPAVIYANIKKFFLKSRIQFRCADFFKADLSDADIVFCYLFGHIMDRFYTEIFPTLRPGTKIISHGFRIKKLKPLRIEMVGKSKIWVYEKEHSALGEKIEI